jgi:hypothetical protein
MVAWKAISVDLEMRESAKVLPDFFSSSELAYSRRKEKKNSSTF